MDKGEITGDINKKRHQKVMHDEHMQEVKTPQQDGHTIIMEKEHGGRQP